MQGQRLFFCDSQNLAAHPFRHEQLAQTVQSAHHLAVHNLVDFRRIEGDIRMCHLACRYANGQAGVVKLSAVAHLYALFQAQVFFDGVLIRLVHDGELLKFGCLTIFLPATVLDFQPGLKIFAFQYGRFRFIDEFIFARLKLERLQCDIVRVHEAPGQKPGEESSGCSNGEVGQNSVEFQVLLRFRMAGLIIYIAALYGAAPTILATRTVVS